MNLSPPISPRVFDTDTFRTKLVRGDFVPRPFQPGSYVTSDSSGATFSNSGAITNQDGSGTALVVNVPTGTNGARIQVPFFGRAFGITFRQTQNAGVQLPDEFSVRIDGVAYAVTTKVAKFTLYAHVLENSIGKVLVSDDLPEGEHLAEITLVAPTAGTDQIYLESYLVEKRAGYAPVRETDVLLTPAAGASVPTVAASIYDTTVSSFPASTFGIGRRISSVHYHNNTGGIQVVTVKYNGLFFRQLTIADKDASVLSFSPPIVMNSLWTHSSPGGGATMPFFVFGSY